MAIVTLAELMAQTGLTGDAPPEDLLSLQQKGAAAQNHIERLLGFRIEDSFGGTDQEPIPEAIRECVMQLASWWFENREAVTDRDRRLPYGVDEIVNEFREWTF